jgi:uncharacterized protein
MSTPTPCIGICSTALGDSVCRGCCRRKDEVDNWVTHKEEGRAAIEAELVSTLTAAFDLCIQVEDIPLALRAAKENCPRRFDHHPLKCRLYHSLGTLTSLEDAGLKADITDLKVLRARIETLWRSSRADVL